jgi:hypothetical protein
MNCCPCWLTELCKLLFLSFIAILLPKCLALKLKSGTGIISIEIEKQASCMPITFYLNAYEEKWNKLVSFKTETWSERHTLILQITLFLVIELRQK